MIRFLRYLFGLRGKTGNRRVAGNTGNEAQKELPYVLDSNKRLLRLQELYAKYKPTPYAEQLYAVLEKTKRIHTYLVSRGRAQELEMFHLQHTDHFISTFSAIIEVHQRHEIPVAPEAVIREAAPKPVPPPPPRQSHRQARSPLPNQSGQLPFEDRIEDMLRKIETGTLKGMHTAYKVSEMVKRVAGEAGFITASEPMHAAGPVLNIPKIAIDTYSRIVYHREKHLEGFKVYKIGFTSPPEEKEAFLGYVSEQLGITGIVYIGNATVHLSNGETFYNSPETLPVINWNGACYVLSLQNNRLHPVSTFRK